MADDLTASELRALRQSVDLPAVWCAKNVGRVAGRTWRSYELGERGIPDVIANRMQVVVKSIKKVLTTLK